MKFEPEDFESMIYPIYGLGKNQSVLKTYAKLNQLPAWKKKIDGLDRDMAQRYIIFMFDPSSPLHAIDNDSGERTFLGLQLAGFELNDDGKYDEVVENMVNFEIDEFVSMVVAFLRSIYNPEWVQFKLQERIYFSIVERAIKDPIGTSSSAVRNAVKDMSLAYEEFTKGNNEVALIRKVYEEAMRENIKISPEAVAEMISKGEKVFSDVSASSGV